MICLYEHNSVERDNTLLYAEVEIRILDTPLIYLKRRILTTELLEKILY